MISSTLEAFKRHHLTSMKANQNLSGVDVIGYLKSTTTHLRRNLSSTILNSNKNNISNNNSNKNSNNNFQQLLLMSSNIPTSVDDNIRNVSGNNNNNSNVETTPLTEYELMSRLDKMLKMCCDVVLFRESPSTTMLRDYILQFLLDLATIFWLSPKDNCVYKALNQIKDIVCLQILRIVNFVIFSPNDNNNNNNNNNNNDNDNNNNDNSNVNPNSDCDNDNINKDKLLVINMVTNNLTKYHIFKNVSKNHYYKASLLSIGLHKFLSRNMSTMLKKERNIVEELMECLQLSGGILVWKVNRPMSERQKRANDQEVKKYVNDYKMLQQAWLKQIDLFTTKAENQLSSLTKRIKSTTSGMTHQVQDLQVLSGKAFQGWTQRQLEEQLEVKDAWSKVILDLSHELAVCHSEGSSAKSWSLDPTEGPSQMRVRLKRAYLDLPKKLFLPQYQYKSAHSIKRKCPLSFLVSDNRFNPPASSIVFKLHNIENIEYSTTCSHISVHNTTCGYLLVSRDTIFYVVDYLVVRKNELKIYETDDTLLTIDTSAVTELTKQWYMLKDQAIHLHTSVGRSYLFAFLSCKDRNDLYTFLHNRKVLTNLKQSYVNQLQSLTHDWVSGSMTNFAYLMSLNKLSGRSFNDVMQYPLLPFILSQYNGNHLDLNDPRNFRDLNKNICAQTALQEEKRTEMYSALENFIKSTDTMLKVCHKPYHCHNFLSNAAVVFQYNLRLPPFTQLFVQFQGGKFDCADRVFSSIKDMYNFVTTGINNDAKELTPEFFYLPEFLENSEGFNLGVMHNGHVVHDVTLPPWAKGDPRLFILVHRQALESQIVINNLSSWIDLVFGYKQTGQAAVESFNVYHPNTYFSTVSSTTDEDDTTLRAILSQVRTCGQVPKQLFRHPHPQPPIKSMANLMSDADQRFVSPLDTVSGLKWGDYVGSPERPHPFVIWSKKCEQKVCQLVAAEDMRLFVVCVNKTIVVRGSQWSALLWRQMDGCMKLKYSENSNRKQFIDWPYNFARITCTTPVMNDQLIFFGTHLGLIIACRIHDYGNDVINDGDDDNRDESAQQQRQQRQHEFTTLHGHTSYITDLKVCRPFRVMFSSSSDGMIVYWDLNKLTYIRSLADHKTQVEMLCASDTLGDLASISYQGGPAQPYNHNSSRQCNSLIMLHTINAKRVSQQLLVDEQVTCMTYSSRSEGRSVNMLVAGTKSGVLKLFSSWDLMPVKEIRPFTSQITSSLPPITLITYCCGDRYLVGYTNNHIIFILSHSAHADLRDLKLIYI